MSQLIAALPEMDVEASPAPGLPADGISRASLRPVPLTRFRRLTVLGTLQAKIAAAYVFYWLRGWFHSASDNERHLAETHWRTAMRLLDSMNYLRGAVMKTGQTLANFPDIAPPEIVDTLEQLHFSAPPMHWSLLREMVHNELGDEPEQLFADFNRRAFAAASLGQVHDARLTSGEDVAVKIQYPGIARTIQSDFRNLFTLLLPARLNRDWQSTQAQFEVLRQHLEMETDYAREAYHLVQARTLFQDDDGIVVPRVYPDFSTDRVVTMDRLHGRHLTEFVAGNPSQSERDRIGTLITRFWYRLMFAGRMLYIDFHPGNFLVLDDGRLGVLDFGAILDLDDEVWARFHRMDRALTTGLREDRLPVMKEWGEIADDEPERLRLADDFGVWCWKSRWQDEPFDFGDEADFRHGVDLFFEVIRRRYTRNRPISPVVTRSHYAMRSVLYLLKSRIPIRQLAEEEIQATGWDRSAYT